MLVQRQAAALEAVEIGRLAGAFVAAAADLAQAEVGAAHPVGGAVLMEILAVMIDVERRLAAAGIGAGRGVEVVEVEIVGAGVRFGLRLDGSAGCGGSLRRGAFEQRVLLDLLGDEAFDLEVATARAGGSPAAAAASSPAIG